MEVEWLKRLSLLQELNETSLVVIKLMYHIKKIELIHLEMHSLMIHGLHRLNPLSYIIMWSNQLLLYSDNISRIRPLGHIKDYCITGRANPIS